MARSAANDEARTIVAMSGLGKRYRIAPQGAPPAGVLKRLAGAARAEPAEGALWALRDFSIRIRAGTVTGIIGRNGAGKTTLLRILGRITAPTEGKIRGRGRVFPMLEVGASFHPDFTARENIFFNAAMFGVPREEVRKNLGQIIDFAGVGDRLDERVRDMSGGTYIRLAFSLAVTMQPDLLLADEVLAVGDAAFQEACLDRIRTEKKRGMSVVFVSHDMAAVAGICDRVVWIDNGRIRKIGAPEEIIASYEHDLWRSKSRQVGDAAAATRPVRLLAARTIGPAGHEIAAIAQADGLRIEVIFETDVSSVLITPGVDIFSGATLLMSLWAREPARVTASGVYSAIIDIPPWTFAAQDIRFRAALRAEPAKGAAYVEEIKETQSFQVRGTDRPDPDGKQQKRARAGYIAPQLEWRMRAEPANAAQKSRAVGF